MTWRGTTGHRQAGRRPKECVVTEDADDTVAVVAVEVAPIGMIAKTRKAGTSDRYGASLKAKRSELSGIRSSLKNSLMPSARLWRMPHRPAVFGPMRFWKSEMTLRRNQMLSITATSKNANATSTLRPVISASPSQSPA